jgi:AGCS family alanine or glycine:cation symporter
MFEKLVDITDFLWGTPMIILILAVGIYLSVRTGFFQITGFTLTCKKTFGELFKKETGTGNEGTLTPLLAC